MSESLAWMPISTAPELERIMVAGWEHPSRTTRGYWWWGEDCVAEGRGIEHPDALLWAPIIIPPLPEGPPSIALAAAVKG
jgi:hypothetical protein